MKTFTISPADLQRDYDELQSMQKIALKYNVSGATIHSKIHSLNIKYNKRKFHKVDEGFFSTETENSFYIAGFIAADGCINDLRSSLEVRLFLSEKDILHLEKMKNLLNFTGNINRNANGKYHTYGIVITSNKICDELSRFNIVPRKSLIYTFPYWLIQHPLVNHFMRGYFDGDGSLFTNKNGGITFDIIGSSAFIATYKKILEINCLTSFKPKIINLNHKGTTAFRISKKTDVKNICDFIYHNATIYLNRKKKIYDNWCEGLESNQQCLDSVII